MRMVMGGGSGVATYLGRNLAGGSALGFTRFWTVGFSMATAASAPAAAAASAASTASGQSDGSAYAAASRRDWKKKQRA